MRMLFEAEIADFISVKVCLYIYLIVSQCLVSSQHPEKNSAVPAGVEPSCRFSQDSSASESDMEQNLMKE